MFPGQSTAAQVPYPFGVLYVLPFAPPQPSQHGGAAAIDPAHHAMQFPMNFPHGYAMPPPPPAPPLAASSQPKTVSAASAESRSAFASSAAAFDDSMSGPRGGVSLPPDMGPELNDQFFLRQLKRIISEVEVCVHVCILRFAYIFDFWSITYLDFALAIYTTVQSFHTVHEPRVPLAPIVNNFVAPATAPSSAPEKRKSRKSTVSHKNTLEVYSFNILKRLYLHCHAKLIFISLLLVQ